MLKDQFLWSSLKAVMLGILVSLSVWGFAFTFSVHQAYGGLTNNPRAYAFIPLCLIFMGPLVVAGMLYCRQYQPLLNAAAKVASLSVWVLLMWVPRSVGLVSLMGSEANYQPSDLEMAIGLVPQRIIDVFVGFILPSWASALSYSRVLRPAAHRLSCVLLRSRTRCFCDLKSQNLKVRYSDLKPERPFFATISHFRGKV